MQEYEVEAIIGRRIDQRKNIQYLVKWKKFPIEDSSWEPVKNLQNSQFLISQYELQNSRKKTISIVQVPLGLFGENKDQCFSQQQEIKKKVEEKLRQKREAQKKKQQIQIQKSNEQKKIVPQTKWNPKQQTQMIVLELSEKNGKTYFKVIEDGVQMWRNRNYMLEFFPECLCDYYQRLVLLKQSRNDQ